MINTDQRIRLEAAVSPKLEVTMPQGEAEK